MRVATIAAVVGVLCALAGSSPEALAQSSSTDSKSSSGDSKSVDDKMCYGKKLNPKTDICWHCMYPIKVAGVTTVASNLPDPPSMADYPVCVCPSATYYRYGITMTYWEPSRFIETVKIPHCYPSLGKRVGADKKSDKDGGGESKTGSDAEGKDSMSSGEKSTLKNKRGAVKTDTPVTFQHAHYFTYPVWKTVGLFTDTACEESDSVQANWITESDPTWNSSAKASRYIAPEAILFGTPALTLACIADAVGVNVPRYGLSNPVLFWCMGSWGKTYPISGFHGSADYVQANAGLAARMIFKMYRQGQECDAGIWYCACLYTPLWVKWNHRLQMAKPTRDSTCHQIGVSGMLWTPGKNPPAIKETLTNVVGGGSGSGGGAKQGEGGKEKSGEGGKEKSGEGGGSDKNSPDNFLWMLFKKRTCCLF